MTRTLAASIFIGSAAVLIAASVNTTPSAGFTAHEWGTFTSVAGVDGSAMGWDALTCNDDLPRFVNDFGFRGFKVRLQGNVRMETPVIYLYSPREMEARVRVAFPHGVITEWYPRAEPQIDQLSRADNSFHRLPANLNGMDFSLRTLTGAIEWPSIRVQPGSAPALPLEALPSRYYAARVTNAAPLAVGDQHEKFLFYRGVGRITVPLSARITADGNIVVANTGADPVPAVMLFENRGGRVGFRNLGSLASTVTVEPPSLDSSVRQLQSEVENALLAQGLFPMEAQAMLATWQDSWFEEGSRLIYIVPSRALTEVLPLQIDPVPAQIVRAFVGRIELITAATQRAVESAITRADHAALGPYARFLRPIVQRITYVDPSKRNLAAGLGNVCQ